MGTSTSSLTCTHRALRSEVRLHIDPRAVVSDRRCCCPVVQEQPWLQELRVGWQIGGDLQVQLCARHLVDHPYPDRVAIGRCCDE